MDNPNLIRNVALVGHLHHGKVCSDTAAYDDDGKDMYEDNQTILTGYNHFYGWRNL